MVYEELIRDFFFDMAFELEKEGYEILNNLHTIFGNYKTYEELLMEEMKSKQDQELKEIEEELYENV